MRSLEVIDPADQNPERVLFGAEVTVSEEKNGKNIYRIMGVAESDPDRGWVSWISPPAKALIGARVGDVVDLNLPGGRRLLTVLSIDYPES